MSELSKNPMVIKRLRILSLLKKLPATTYDVAQYLRCSYDTAKSHLEYLEKCGNIEKIHLKHINPEFNKDQLVWQTKKKQRSLIK
jgi:predicted ArsR family transcriptional regulator